MHQADHSLKPQAVLRRAKLDMDSSALEDRLRTLRSSIEPFFQEMQRVLVGQKRLIDRLLMGLMTGGHLLVEGVPGLAKTLAVRTLADTLQLRFSRIQFTPDLLPADLIGTQIYNPRTSEFSVKKGPVFANLVLADEVNRAPAKVQSALLEAMQEKQVTIGEETFKLPEPFLVLATQNPIEQEGTFPLPEAQIDRFLMKLKLDYPEGSEEVEILNRMAHVGPPPHAKAVLTPSIINELRDFIDAIYLDDKVKHYIVDLVQTTRRPQRHQLPLDRYIQYGASPRGSLGLALAGKANAFLEGRAYVTPHDVKAVAADVLRHRILISYEAEADGVTPEVIIGQLLAKVPIP